MRKVIISLLIPSLTFIVREAFKESVPIVFYQSENKYAAN